MTFALRLVFKEKKQHSRGEGKGTGKDPEAGESLVFF